MSPIQFPRKLAGIKQGANKGFPFIVTQIKKDIVHAPFLLKVARLSEALVRRATYPATPPPQLP